MSDHFASIAENLADNLETVDALRELSKNLIKAYRSLNKKYEDLDREYEELERQKLEMMMPVIEMSIHAKNNDEDLAALKRMVSSLKSNYVKCLEENKKLKAVISNPN